MFIKFVFINFYVKKVLGSESYFKKVLDSEGPMVTKLSQKYVTLTTTLAITF